MEELRLGAWVLLLGSVSLAVAGCTAPAGSPTAATSSLPPSSSSTPTPSTGFSGWTYGIEGAWPMIPGSQDIPDARFQEVVRELHEAIPASDCPLPALPANATFLVHLRDGVRRCSEPDRDGVTAMEAQARSEGRLVQVMLETQALAQNRTWRLVAALGNANPQDVLDLELVAWAWREVQGLHYRTVTEARSPAELEALADPEPWMHLMGHLTDARYARYLEQAAGTIGGTHACTAPFDVISAARQELGLLNATWPRIAQARGAGDEYTWFDREALPAYLADASFLGESVAAAPILAEIRFRMAFWENVSLEQVPSQDQAQEAFAVLDERVESPWLHERLETSRFAAFDRRHPWEASIPEGEGTPPWRFFEIAALPSFMPPFAGWTCS